MSLNKEKLQEEIEIFRAQISLPDFKVKSDIQSIISIATDASALANTTPLHLLEMATVLAGYAAFITSQENRLLTYVNWCESTIKSIVGRELDSVEGYGFNEKDTKIRANNEHIVKIEEVKKITQAKYELIKNLSYKISFLAERLENLAKEKRHTLRE